MRPAASFLVLLLLSSWALAQTTKTIEQIVARVNAEIILKSDYEKALKQMSNELAQQGVQGPDLQREVAERTKHLMRDLIDQSLLIQKAKDLNISSDLEVIKAMEKLRKDYNFTSMDDLEKAIVQQGGSVEDFKQGIRNRYLTQQVLGGEVYRKIVITTEELRKYYDEHQKDFDKPEGVRLREIVFMTEGKKDEEIAAAEKKARDVLEKLRNGEDFGELASQNSEVQTAQSGGDLGFFEKGTMSKEFEEIAYRLDRKGLSDVVKMPYGFVILKLEDKHTGGILPFELARDEIQDVLWRQMTQPKVREYLTQLRSEGFVEVREGYTDSGAPPAKSAKPSEK